MKGTDHVPVVYLIEIDSLRIYLINEEGVKSVDGRRNEMVEAMMRHMSYSYRKGKAARRLCSRKLTLIRPCSLTHFG